MGTNRYSQRRCLIRRTKYITRYLGYISLKRFKRICIYMQQQLDSLTFTKYCVSYQQSSSYCTRVLVWRGGRHSVGVLYNKYRKRFQISSPRPPLNFEAPFHSSGSGAKLIPLGSCRVPGAPVLIATPGAASISRRLSAILAYNASKYVLELSLRKCVSGLMCSL